MTEEVLPQFRTEPAGAGCHRHVGQRITTSIAACVMAVGLMLLTDGSALAASASGQAPVYSDVYQGGYRGWVSGGVTLLCWKDGSWANGTNRWFAVYGGSISGFVNANLISAQYPVKQCS